MRRFIDLGNQTFNCEEGHKEFAFYCTVSDTFMNFGGSFTFETVSEFTDYAKGHEDIDRCLRLIPKTWER